MIHDGHAFLIKDINKLAKTYSCINCQAHFTKACHLQRQAKTCAQGRTIINCPNEQVKIPHTPSERPFYAKNNTSPSAIRWLTRESRRLGKHVHHVACGHGGKRRIVRAPVDGYEPTTRTVFQYHGCHWHQYPRCFTYNHDKIVSHNQTSED